MAADAQDLAGRGYVVLAYSARGFGRSTGQIGLNDPRYEIADLSSLIDGLAERDEAESSSTPRATRASAWPGFLRRRAGAARRGYDDRVDAIAPQITWNSLTTALFPSQTGDDRRRGTVAATPQDDDAGVYNKLWAGLFFGVGSVAGRSPRSHRHPVRRRGGRRGIHRDHMPPTSIRRTSTPRASIPRP